MSPLTMTWELRQPTLACEAGFYLEGNEVQVCMDDDGMDASGIILSQPSLVLVSLIKPTLQ